MRFSPKSVCFFSIDPRRSGFKMLRIAIDLAKNRSNSDQKHPLWAQNPTHQFGSCIQIPSPIKSLKLNKLVPKKAELFCWRGFICRREMRFSPKSVYFFLDRSAKERVRKDAYLNHFRKKQVQKVAKMTYFGPNGPHQFRKFMHPNVSALRGMRAPV